LVLSKKLANALGGDVKLTETTPDVGSTFVVTIDPELPEDVLFQSSEHNVVSTDATPECSIDLSGLKILLVDDSPDNQVLIMRILTLAGATVEVASNGIEAVQMAQAGDFSLVLMDIQMPQMDGYEATKILRASGYSTPIIALTAYAMKDERLRTLSRGFDDHIPKPVDPNSLVDALSGYLG
jgi:CheY-like chemotaxis protein